MASQSTAEPSNPEVCHLCQLPVPTAVKHAHEKGLQHQAAQKIAAVALDRWRGHFSANLGQTDPVQDAEAENVTFCDICTEAMPSASFSRHLTSRAHLISALDSQVFEELVKGYIDEEDLKLLGGLERKDDGSASEKSDAKNTYTCQMCALQVPVAFKETHEHSIHHKTRVALATAAARRTSAFLHNQTPIGVKRNIKMTELLKSYTGIDLLKKPSEEKEDVIEKEVEEKASQVEIKKRLTAKQYFTDILPYLQYTEALYTIIVDDTEYVTIKNTNGTCMSVHIANFNGIYSDTSDAHLKCRMCNGYNQYMTYSSENDHDKLHVMSLGHIRHVLTPIDNMHGLRKIDNGQALCVICNAFMPEHAIENHIFNDIHHTAALAEALKLGENFKETKNDLKIVIYTAPPVEKTNYMINPVRNFPRNNAYFGGGISLPYGVNVAFPQGGPVSKPHGGLFGATNASALSNPGPASVGFGASTGSGGTFGANSASTGTFGANPASTGSIFGSGPASTGTTFGTGLGYGSANIQSLGATPASGFGVTANIDSSASAADSFSFGIKPASTGGTGLFGAGPANTGIFGVSPANNTASTADNLGFGAKHAKPATGNSVAFGASTGFGVFGASSASGDGANNNGTNTSNDQFVVNVESQGRSKEFV